MGSFVVLTFLLSGCDLRDSAEEEAEDPQGAPGTDHTSDDLGPEQNVSDDDVVIVVEDGTEVHQDCQGREVRVTADDAAVVLDGPCGLVRTSGRGTTVDVGTATKIVLVGVDNTVSFAEGEPEVVNQGRNTSVKEGGTASA